ncbi:MAG: hypothetical protein LUD84_09665 [Clostridiales bacterium]|nr:hypothetical protein [Clostridiales bacterium]
MKTSTALKTAISSIVQAVSDGYIGAEAAYNTLNELYHLLFAAEQKEAEEG